MGHPGRDRVARHSCGGKPWNDPKVGESCGDGFCFVQVCKHVFSQLTPLLSCPSCGLVALTPCWGGRSLFPACAPCQGCTGANPAVSLHSCALCHLCVTNTIKTPCNGELAVLGHGCLYLPLSGGAARLGDAATGRIPARDVPAGTQLTPLSLPLEKVLELPTVFGKSSMASQKQSAPWHGNISCGVTAAVPAACCLQLPRGFCSGRADCCCSGAP